MKKPELKINQPRKKLEQSAVSLISILLAAACLVILNLCVNSLPASWKTIDVSQSQVTVLSTEAKAVLQALDQEIEIIILAEDDMIDERIKVFLANMQKETDLISVKTIDPVLHPTAAEEYGASENSVIIRNVSSGQSEIVYLSDIVVFDMMSYYYYGSYIETEFDGEGQLVAAIQQVTSDSSHKIYLTASHNEASLSSSLISSIEKSGFSIETVNLLMEGAIPLDCELLVLYAPTSDLADDELEMIREYLAYGDVLIVLSTDVVSMESQPNLTGLLAEYNLRLLDGYAADLQRCYQNNPYLIFPVLSSSSSITSAISSDNLVLLAYSRALETTTEHEDIQTTVFMSSSNDALVVSESSEAEAQLVFGVTAQSTLEEGRGRLTVITSDGLVNPEITERFSNLANTTVFTNALSDNFDDIVNVSFSAKSLEVTYNTIMNPGFYSLLMIAVIPLGLLIVGLVIWMKRRRA